MEPFIPIKPDKSNISVRLDTAKLNRLDSIAYQYSVSRNFFINQCIDFALEHLKDPG